MSNTALPQGPWMSPYHNPEPVSDHELVLADVWAHLELLCQRPPDDRRRVIIDGLDVREGAGS